MQGFHRLLGEVAIYASNRQATFYVVHGLPAAQQLQLLVDQPSGVLASNYAIKWDLRENTGFKLIIGRVGPLFWLLELMAYDNKAWRERYAERGDLSTRLTHLTRPVVSASGNKNALQVLFDILDSGILKGSTTSSGFIVGNTPAVCFQDAPIHAVAQNCWFEQKWRKANQSAKIRYTSSGLMLPKAYVYNYGGRPVIYDATQQAKNYLPASEWWRIVNFDLSNSNNLVDWSHEREWRTPGDLPLDIEQVTLLLVNPGSHKTFIELCEAANKDYYRRVSGVVTMEAIQF